MRKVNPFFLMGTVGMFVTAVLKILLASVSVTQEVVLASALLYPIFLLFLLGGTILMMGRRKTTTPDNQKD